MPEIGAKYTYIILYIIIYTCIVYTQTHTLIYGGMADFVKSDKMEK